MKAEGGRRKAEEPGSPVAICEELLARLQRLALVFALLFIGLVSAALLIGGCEPAGGAIVHDPSSSAFRLPPSAFAPAPLPEQPGQGWLVPPADRVGQLVDKLDALVTKVLWGAAGLLAMLFVGMWLLRRAESGKRKAEG